MKRQSRRYRHAVPTPCARPLATALPPEPHGQDPPVPTRHIMDPSHFKARSISTQCEIDSQTRELVPAIPASVSDHGTPVWWRTNARQPAAAGPSCSPRRRARHINLWFTQGPSDRRVNGGRGIRRLDVAPCTHFVNPYLSYIHRRLRKRAPANRNLPSIALQRRRAPIFERFGPRSQRLQLSPAVKR